MGAHLLGGCMMWQDPSMQWLPGVLTRYSLACVLVIALYGTIIVCMSLIEGCSTSGVKKGLLCPCPGAIGHLTRRPLLIYSQIFGRRHQESPALMLGKLYQVQTVSY